MKTIQIESQPDDVTCGPTCLHAVYRYLGDRISLKQVIDEVNMLDHGGTLAVMLACHALRRGFATSIYTYNIKLFDPTWFADPSTDIAAKLVKQRSLKQSKSIQTATESYLEYLRLGGRLHYEDLTPGLLHGFIRQNLPVLTGVSSTYLYGSSREVELTPRRTAFDDLAGTPAGHFVIMFGDDTKHGQVRIADPYRDNPAFRRRYYSVKVGRFINAVIMGLLTNDANFLIIRPKTKVA